MAEQALHSPELVVRGAGDGQLDLVAVGRERFQDGISQWRCRCPRDGTGTRLRL